MAWLVFCINGLISVCVLEEYICLYLYVKGWVAHWAMGTCLLGNPRHGVGGGGELFLGAENSPPGK